MDLQELSKANLVLFRPLHFCAAAFGLYRWQILGVCGKLSTFRLCGAGVAHSGSSYFSSEHTVYPPAGGYRVLSLLLLCGRCENGVNYTLMSNAGCVAAAQNIQWTIV